MARPLNIYWTIRFNIDRFINRILKQLGICRQCGIKCEPNNDGFCSTACYLFNEGR